MQAALGDPNNHDPHGIGIDGATRVGGAEVTNSSRTPAPGGKGE